MGMCAPHLFWSVRQMRGTAPGGAIEKFEIRLWDRKLVAFTRMEPRGYRRW